MITRRTALKKLGALGAAAAAPRLLTGCDGSGTGPGTVEPKGITTIVTLCMENRSYDHFLGARSMLEGLAGDGLVAGMKNLDMAGNPVEIHHADVACVADPPHGWNPSHAQWNSGKNDGFLTEYQAREGANIPPHVMGYMTRADLPVTWALADAYTSCDRWFCSLLGPTWPNRLYLHTAQSGGTKTNDVPVAGKFDWPTIYHRLNEAKVPWKYYYSDLPFLALFGGEIDPGGAVSHLDYDFFDDAQAGRLPPVVFIDPAFTMNDDHPPHHPIFGQQLIASIYSALASSPQWNNILFVITYDENGGFFDHVPPPEAADDRPEFAHLGFRVPTMVIGPYAKKGHVSSTVHDHTSVLAHIEKMFKLAPLTARDAAANDLSDAIDQARLAALDPAPPVKLPEVVIDESQIGAACKGVRGPKTDIEDLADAGFFPEGLDRRGRVKEHLYAVGDMLARFGSGGVRRGR